MKKTLKLSILAVMALSSSLSADFISEGKVSGSVQEQYRTFGGSDINTMDTFTTSGNLKLETKKDLDIYGAVNFYGIGDLGLNGDETNNMFLENGHEYTILNEAYIGVNLDKTGIKGKVEAGRFFMKSALVNSLENSRYDLPIPNSFEGIQASITPMPNMKICAAWIDGMAGPENGGDKTKFENIDTVAGNYNSALDGRTGSGLYLLRGSYDFEKFATLTLENRYVDAFSNTFYEEANVNVESFVKTGFNLKVSQQYINEDSKDNIVDANAMGLKVSGSYDKIDASIAYNRTGGNTGLTGFNYGSDPLFTSMYFMNDYGDIDNDGIKIEGKYNINNVASATVAYGNFQGKTSDFDAVEISGDYKFDKNIAFKSVATYSQNNTVNSEEGSFRLLASYTF